MSLNVTNVAATEGETSDSLLCCHWAPALRYLSWSIQPVTKWIAWLNDIPDNQSDRLSVLTRARISQCMTLGNWVNLTWRHRQEPAIYPNLAQQRAPLVLHVDNPGERLWWSRSSVFYCHCKTLLSIRTQCVQDKLQNNICIKLCLGGSLNTNS